MRAPVDVAVLADQDDRAVAEDRHDDDGVGDLDDVVFLFRAVVQAQDVAPQPDPGRVVDALRAQDGERPEGRRVRREPSLGRTTGVVAFLRHARWPG